MSFKNCLQYFSSVKHFTNDSLFGLVCLWQLISSKAVVLIDLMLVFKDHFRSVFVDLVLSSIKPNLLDFIEKVTSPVFSIYLQRLKHSSEKFTKAVWGLPQWCKIILRCCPYESWLISWSIAETLRDTTELMDLYLYSQ